MTCFIKSKLKRYNVTADSPITKKRRRRQTPSGRNRQMLIQRKRKAIGRGFSIVEVVVAAVVIAVAVVGTSGFRYHSALDWRRAVRHTSAARAALLLCESWRGTGGDEDYNPVSHLGANTNIATGDGPEQPDGYTLLGSYTLSVNGTLCYATLSWKDVTEGLRALNVAVAWTQRGENGGGYDAADKIFPLTTYAAN
jgi:hypothetical protein